MTKLGDTMTGIDKRHFFVNQKEGGEKMGYETNLVTKSNTLVLAKHDCSSWEQDIILTFISMLDPRTKLTDAPHELEISAADFLKLTRTRTKNYSGRLKEIAEKLLAKTFFIEKPNGEWIGINWFHHIRYDKQNGGVIVCRFHEMMMPFILDLHKRFTSYQLENIIRLRSKFSKRLYEILAMRLQQSKRQKEHTWDVTLSHFKELLYIPKSYKWGDVERRVLRPAKSEFTSTDLRFEYSTKKRGRRIYSLKFDITNTHQLALELPPSESDSDTPTNEKNQAESLLDLIPATEKKSVKKLLVAAQKKYPPEYIREKILLANDQKPKNYGAWLRAALADDYQPPARKPKKPPVRKPKKIDPVAEKIDAEILRAREIRRRFAVLPAAERQRRKQEIFDGNPGMIAAQAVQEAAPSMEPGFSIPDNQSSFKCQRCNYAENADYVAALNILAAGHVVSACGEGALAPSLKQELVENREVSPLQVAI